MDGYADGNANGIRCALSCNCPCGTLSGEGRCGLLKDKWSVFFFYAGSYCPYQLYCTMLAYCLLASANCLSGIIAGYFLKYYT